MLKRKVTSAILADLTGFQVSGLQSLELCHHRHVPSWCPQQSQGSRGNRVNLGFGMSTELTKLLQCVPVSPPAQLLQAPLHPWGQELSAANC